MGRFSWVNAGAEASTPVGGVADPGLQRGQNSGAAPLAWKGVRR